MNKNGSFEICFMATFDSQANLKWNLVVLNMRYNWNLLERICVV